MAKAEDDAAKAQRLEFKGLLTEWADEYAEAKAKTRTGTAPEPPVPTPATPPATDDAPKKGPLDFLNGLFPGIDGLFK